MIIHQILSSASPRDAITHEAQQFRARFRDWGWGGYDHAPRVAPGIDGFRSIERLQAQRDDVLLVHHSASMPKLDHLLALPNPTLLLYHNITPAQYLWDHAPLTAAHCAVGREQLPSLVRASDVAAAHSAYTATELDELGAQRTAVIPLLVDLARLGPRRNGLAAATRPPAVLFVGRLSPHKRQDDLIRAFAAFRAHRAPQAKLALVGDGLTPRYVDILRGQAEALAPGAVTIESGLSDAALGDRYRAASVFVCLSEHEGFCAPLLEAFHIGVPVIARPSGSIPEVAGDAAILVEDRDPAVIAELIHLVVEDDELRAELVGRGRKRLQQFSNETIESKLRSTIEETVATSAARR